MGALDLVFKGSVTQVAINVVGGSFERRRALPVAVGLRDGCCDVLGPGPGLLAELVLTGCT